MITAADYNEMTDGVEHPEDDKPHAVDAIRARKRALREGRLHIAETGPGVPIEPPPPQGKDDSLRMSEEVVSVLTTVVPEEEAEESVDDQAD